MVNNPWDSVDGGMIRIGPGGQAHQDAIERRRKDDRHFKTGYRKIKGGASKRSKEYVSRFCKRYGLRRAQNGSDSG